jgi:serine/threonine protein kinase
MLVPSFRQAASQPSQHGPPAMIPCHRDAVTTAPATTEPVTLAFGGTERFEIIRALGQGGMGVVFEAFDREQGASCALKLLPRATPRALVRFKREFRALQGLHHPNLITIGELLHEKERWFFTMELVEGIDLLSWIRGKSGDAADAPPAQVTVTLQDVTPVRLVGNCADPVRADFDEARLRETFAQLAEGLRFLHDAGKIHRDVKPSNILVTPTGRVVILDFGLVADFGELEPSRGASGSPGYMAPERILDGRVGPAADMYAMGAVLYRAFTGNLPSEVSSLRSALLCGSIPAPRPSALAPGVPRDLDDLCAELLDPKPELRPSAEDVLTRLGNAEHRSVEPPPVFVGRRRELDQILLAYEQSAHHPVVVVVDGPSGIGKTALLDEWATRLRARDDRPLVLTGRCYEHEGIPYKAIDGVMDTLGDTLAAASEEILRTLPAQAHLLALLFPALSRVPAFAHPDARAIEPSDPHQIRRDAELVGRLLFRALATWRPLVVVIDDFQWSDPDSLTFLAALTRGPAAPPFLLLVSSRTPRGLPFGDDVRSLSLAPLTHQDARELAARLLRGAAGPADAIAAEAGGNPFFVAELARSVTQGGRGRARLEDVLWNRISACGEETRKILELVAVAAAPIAQAVVARAAGLDAGAFRRVAQDLRTKRLVRTLGLRPEDDVETHHDRIRETVVAKLESAARVEHHLRLAMALESLRPDNLDALVTHFEGGGDGARAARYALLAGDQAARTFAFERAATYYRRALAFLPGQLAEREERVREKLADALANAGLGAEAAAEYQRAAEHSEPTQALELHRRAADHLLRSGRLDEGLSVLGAILQRVRVRVPRTPLAAFASLLLRRARVRLRGLSFTERSSAQISRSDIFRVDTLWAAAARLGPIDTIRAADFQARHLLLSLRLGEPFRVARALMAEASFHAMGGPRRMRLMESILARARPIVNRIEHPYATAMLHFTEGFAHYQFGQYAPAFERLSSAAELFRTTCTGASHDAGVSDRFALDSLFHLGELAELTRRGEALLNDAEQRGDLYLAAELRTGLPNVIWLCRDQPDEARRSNELGIAPWSHRSFYLQHYYHALASAHTAIYCGDGRSALRTVEWVWPKLRSSLLLKVQAVRTEALYLIARAAIADGSDRSLEVAERMATKLSGEAVPSAPGLAAAARAGVAARRGHHERSFALLRVAEQALAAADAGICAAACRFHLGEPEAKSWMRARGIVRPDRFAALLVPGFSA